MEPRHQRLGDSQLAKLCTALGGSGAERPCPSISAIPFPAGPSPRKVFPPLPNFAYQSIWKGSCGLGTISCLPLPLPQTTPPPRVVPHVAYTRVLPWEVRVEVHIPLGDPTLHQSGGRLSTSPRGTENAQKCDELPG